MKDDYKLPRIALTTDDPEIITKISEAFGEQTVVMCNANNEPINCSTLTKQIAIVGSGLDCRGLISNLKEEMSQYREYESVKAIADLDNIVTINPRAFRDIDFCSIVPASEYGSKRTHLSKRFRPAPNRNRNKQSKLSRRKNRKKGK